MARNLPELIFFISMLVSRSYSELGIFNSVVCAERLAPGVYIRRNNTKGNVPETNSIQYVFILPSKTNRPRYFLHSDVYDALSSQRVYKEPWDQEQVLDELWRRGGSISTRNDRCLLYSPRLD